MMYFLSLPTHILSYPSQQNISHPTRTWLFLKLDEKKIANQKGILHTIGHASASSAGASSGKFSKSNSHKEEPHSYDPYGHDHGDYHDQPHDVCIHLIIIY